MLRQSGATEKRGCDRRRARLPTAAAKVALAAIVVCAPRLERGRTMCYECATFAHLCGWSGDCTARLPVQLAARWSSIWLSVPFLGGIRIVNVAAGGFRQPRSGGFRTLLSVVPGLPPSRPPLPVFGSAAFSRRSQRADACI